MENKAFADALARARQLAAKLSGQAPNAQAQGHGAPPHISSGGGGMKRIADDFYGEPDAKRPMAPLNDPFGAQLAAMKQGSRPSGVTTGLGISGSGQACAEEIRIPDGLVGLIIGRGGEQISKIQAETGCKVQVSPESNPGKDRPCFLQGTKDSIERAKDMIMDIITTKGGHSAMGGMNMNKSAGGGSTTVELMIPGSRVGLIIGKGGETIRQLQDKTGTKMYILQENMFEECDKPLRIVGEPDLVENARQMVLDLIAEGPGKQEMAPRQRSEYGGGGDDSGGGGGMMRGRSHGGPGMETMKFPVPKVSVGLIIGKGGDMIKRIQTETGAKIQFDPINSNMGDLDEQLAIITGKPEQISQAQVRIEELVETALSGKQERGGGGGGGRSGGDRWDGENQGREGGGRGRRHYDGEEERFQVPANRVGMVIGKGGETIRQINQQSGAHCEIDRSGPQDGPEKVFVVRGTLQQIEYAKELIMEKVNTLPPKGQRGDFGQGNGQNWGGGGYGNDQQSSADTTAQWAAYYAQYYAQSQATGGAAQPDYTQQWIEYLRAQGQHEQANLLEQQSKASKQPQGSSPAASSAPTNPNGASNAQASPAGQSIDYSQQWADHYRAIGKIAEAEAIENYIKAQKQGGANNGSQQPGTTAASSNYYGGTYGASAAPPPGTEPSEK